MGLLLTLSLIYVNCAGVFSNPDLVNKAATPGTTQYKCKKMEAAPEEKNMLDGIEAGEISKTDFILHQRSVLADYMINDTLDIGSISSEAQEHRDRNEYSFTYFHRQWLTAAIQPGQDVFRLVSLSGSDLLMLIQSDLPVLAYCKLRVKSKPSDTRSKEVYYIMDCFEIITEIKKVIPQVHSKYIAKDETVNRLMEVATRSGYVFKIDQEKQIVNHYYDLISSSVLPGRILIDECYLFPRDSTQRKILNGKGLFSPDFEITHLADPSDNIALDTFSYKIERPKRNEAPPPKERPPIIMPPPF